MLRHARCFAGMEDDQNRAERAGKSQPRVFVNGKLVYADKLSRRAMFAGEWRLRVASGNGDNEVAVAIANNLFGWKR